MQRVKLGLVCLSWLWLASAVSAQSAAVDPTTGVASVSNFSGGGMLDGTYFDVRHVIGDGVGYQNSYSQIGAFTPFWINEDAFIATNSRLIVTNSTQTGVNSGLVGRQFVQDWDRIFGVYGYYDNDEDSRNFRYSQFTFGAETLGQWWDLRGNAYFVNGMNNNVIAQQGIGGQPFYMGHNIDFLGKQLTDRALSGGDGEFGVPLSPSTPWLRGYAGLYGYQTGNNNTYGFRGRVEATVSNDLTLSVMVSNDAIYGTNVNGVIDFKFSGFQPTRYFPNLSTRQRMLNPVQRNWRIATHTIEENVNVAALNPATGKPYFIVHVNNTAAAGGDGTIEHPFQHLQNLSQADIILVHRGTATSTTNTVTGSAILHDNERLLGDGILSTVQLAARFGPSSVFGTYNLPQTANTGVYPYVTNRTGNIVTLANNNEVAGLNLWGAGAGGTAITNTAAGSNNFNLHNLEIFNNTGKGINLANASGVGIINKINVGTTDHANPGGFGNNAGGGIQIATGGSGLFLNMADVRMNASAPSSQAFGVSLTANNAGLTALMNNVFANGNGQGILFTETSQALAVDMNRVRAGENLGTGIQVVGTGGSIDINGNDVAAMDNGSNNLQIGTQAAPIVTSTVGVSFTQANFSGSKTGSGIVFSMSGGGGTLNLPGPSNTPGATVSQNHLDGLAIYATNSAVMNANVQNGQFTLNGRDAFHVDENSFSRVNLFVDPTNATLNGGNGLFFNLAGSSAFNTSFLNSNLNNNNQDAIDGILTSFSTVNLFFDGTTGANSGGTGMNIKATDQSVANLEVDHGDLNPSAPAGAPPLTAVNTHAGFSNSGRLIAGSSAINIFSDNSTVNLLTNMTSGANLAPASTRFVPASGATPAVPANYVPGNQAYGLTLDIRNHSSFTGTIENGGVLAPLGGELFPNGGVYPSGGFSYARVDAVKANVTSLSNASLTLINTEASHAGFDGVVTTVDNATLVTSFTNSNVNNSGRNGMTLTVTNAGKLASTYDNSSLNGSGGSGIFATVTGTNSIANLNLLNNSDVIGSGNSGLNFNVDSGTLNVAAISSSFSNSGTKGVVGSGVIGVINNNGVGRLNFINTDINNNLDSGIFVTTNNGSSIQTQFSIASIANNGISQLSPHNNDGILLQINDSPFSSLSLTNGATVSGNGNDGVAIVATQSSNVLGLFDTISIVNNGVAPPPFVGTRAGFNVITASNSNVGLTFNGVTIGNTAAGGPQQTGFLSNSIQSSALMAAFTSANLSNNLNDAINTNVGTKSEASLSLINVSGDNSGNTGALFNVTGGGQLNVVSSVASSFSQSGGSGLLVQVDGANSVANFDLDGITLNNNGSSFGGQGFSGVATGGGTLNAVIVAAQLTNNSNQGIELNVTGANSVANFHVQSTTVDFNSSEGLLLAVSNQGVANYRSVNSSYNNNGANGALDGVNVTVIGNGPADSATARLLFSGGTVDANAGNGFSLDAENGATLTTSLQNISASNNTRYGIFSTATGTNTKFNLLMSGTNTLTGNGLGAMNPLVFSDINQAVLEVSGSFNNGAGDGVHIDLQNMVNAVVAVDGPGTINNNQGNGIFVNLKNVTNGSLLVQDFTSIDTNGLDGIKVNFDTVTNGAIAIDGTTANGPTTINGSVTGDAIDMTLTNTNLVNNLNYGGATIQILTLNNNQPPSAFNNQMTQLPIPVTFALNGLGLTPANALTINDITASNSGNTGINILATNTNIAANGSFITNNSVTGSAVGDGLHLDFHTVTADGLVIDHNGLQSNAGNGLNLDLFNTPINGLTITNNSGGLSAAGGTLDFTYTNAIFTTFMQNNSTPGLNIASVTLDISPVNQFWRPDLTPAGSGAPAGSFIPISPTDVTVGLDSVDGVAITPGNYPVQGTGGNVLPFGGIPVDSQQMTLGFNNFTPSGNAIGSFPNQFHYQLSHGDNSSIGNTQQPGTSMAGSTGTVTLADGRTASGVFTANGLEITKVFAATSAGISSNGLDGIRLNLNNSSLTNLNISNNTVTNNGTDGLPATPGHGIEFTGAGGAVVNSNITNATINSNSITGNAGDGVRLVNPTTVANTISVGFANNDISQNAGTGVNLSLVTGQQNLQASFASNTINSNTAGAGINIHLADNRNTIGGFDGNTISGNSAQGVNFTMGLNGHITSNFTNNTINGNGSDGIHLGLNTGGHYEGAQFFGNTIGIATSRNGGMGVNLIVPDQASYNWKLGDSTQAANLISGNTGAGVGINMTGSATGALTVQNSTFSNTAASADPNFNGQGLAILMNNTATLNNVVIGDGLVNPSNTIFSSNATAGLSITALGNATMQNLLINNVSAINNTGDGIDITRIGNPTFTGTTIENSQILSNANGVHIVAGNALLTDDYLIQNNVMSNNRIDGLVLDARFDATIAATITSNTFNLNGGDGIHVIEQQNAFSDNRDVRGSWTLNTITNNTGNGIEIHAQTGVTGLPNDQIFIGTSTTEFQNIITGNHGDGILITGVNGVQTVLIQGNEIDNNGTAGNGNSGIAVNATNNGSTTVKIDTNMIDNNIGNGVQLLSRNLGSLTASIDNSEIRFNSNDGVQINANGTSFINVTIGTLNPNGNDISDNSGVGINILNQNNAAQGLIANFTIANNAINRNGLEGVYAVNSADGGQTQNGTVNTTANGNVFDHAAMNFTMNNNSVLDNGHLASGANFSDVTGLYLRVGTNGATQNNVQDPGGFASNASAVNSIDTANNTGRGGVLAFVTNNVFGGNAGHDVGFDSFTSTVAPVATTGVWTDQNENPPNPANDQYTVNGGFQTDPLARLDLKFTSNTGDDAMVTRSGAFYNNADQVFKSRIGNNPGAVSPGGPFNTGGRDRNAQRLASRAGQFSAPNKIIFATNGGISGVSSQFLYPGVGSSTFRVTTNSSTSGFASQVTTFGSAFQLNNGINIGELPFAWDQSLLP